MDTEILHPVVENVGSTIKLNFCMKEYRNSRTGQNIKRVNEFEAVDFEYIIK